MKGAFQILHIFIERRRVNDENFCISQCVFHYRGIHWNRH